MFNFFIKIFNSVIFLILEIMLLIPSFLIFLLYLVEVVIDFLKFIQEQIIILKDELSLFLVKFIDLISKFEDNSFFKERNKK